jgi:predicted PurR-regulated permease PerM
VAKTSTNPAWQVALIVLTSTVVGIVVLAVLYWAQAVFIPIAMAVFFTFLLATPVTALQRRGVGRTPSVLLVVLAAAMVLGGVIWVVGAQARSLVSESPQYTENIKGKIKSLRQMGHGPGTKRLEEMIEEITGAWDSPAGSVKDGAADNAVPAPKKRPEVVVRPETPAWLTSLPALLGRLAEALGGLAMALVLLVFMLLKREDLRNRLIRLMGHGRITATTKALDDAGQRISRFLLMQLIVNGTFGLTVALGLLAIGVPYAILWGFLGFTLRYIPYIGPWIAALLPILLSLAMFEGWMQPLLVIGLFLVIELISNNVIEPRLYGHSIGVSTVALLIAAAFWTFLWGPVGLVLSSPLTVCLVVLGKYVPQLKFFDVLLGDEPPLDAHVTFYQRLLARDQDEAAELVLTHIKASSPEQVYDELLIPALNYVKRDRERDDLTESDEQSILQALREILEDLGERREVVTQAEEVIHAEERGNASAPTPLSVLACPARDQADRLALEMLRQLLDPAKWVVRIAAVETMTADLVTQVAEQTPALVCIGALPPGGLAHTRYLCKKLRARFPKIKIVVGRWGLRGNAEENREQFQDAGADLMATTMLETRSQLGSLRPILVQEKSRNEGSDDRAEELPPTVEREERGTDALAPLAFGRVDQQAIPSDGTDN